MRVAQHRKGTGVITMSSFDLDDWDDEEEESTGPANLRKALKDAQRKLKAAEQLLADQGKRIRKRTIGDAIAAKGLNPKLAALVPSDIDSTEEAINAWVKEFADVFTPATVGKEAEGGSEGSEGQVANQSFFTEEELAAQGIINRANGGHAAPPGSEASTFEKLMASDGNPEDILQIAQGG